jgi:alkanesulfonate monooxygenase SsuD/methylene tetrahydromethanopterin reductase-like flavin-dependent oxidoreductase (luciferase family)
VTIEVGMTMPTMLHHDRQDVLDWCRSIDEGPWSTLAVPERITYTSHSQIAELAAASVLTERVRLCTTIIILPAHNAVMMAKHLATIDRMCDGRLTVGVGVGGREHDYRAIDGRFDHRWQRMDDQIATMRGIWAGEAPFEDADPVGPPPVQPGGPPLVAGAMGPKALARAARWAVGVDHGGSILGLRAEGTDTTSFLDFRPEELAATIKAATDAWESAGRKDRPRFTTSLFYALGPNARDRLQKYTSDYLTIVSPDYAKIAAESAMCFDEARLRDTVAAMEEAGCDEVLLTSSGTGVDEVNRACDVLWG